MALTTLDQFLGAVKQRLVLSKSTLRTTVPAYPFSVFDVAGVPGAGVLAGTSTTSGEVPTSATAGCPKISAFGDGETGYITRIEGSNTVSCRITLYDMLWKGGNYAFNANTSGNTPTGFEARLPNGDYTGLELWYEQVTASTGNPAVTVAYLNELGAAKSTGLVQMGAAATVGRMMPLPLATDDKGVQGVTGVVASVATGGTFNLLVLRPLAEVRIRTAADGVVQDLLATGAPRVYADSALIMVVTADATSTGNPRMLVDVSYG